MGAITSIHSPVTRIHPCLSQQESVGGSVQPREEEKEAGFTDSIYSNRFNITNVSNSL